MFSKSKVKKAERVKKFFDAQKLMNEQWDKKISILESVKLDLFLERRKRKTDQIIRESNLNYFSSASPTAT